jgi:membrane protease subunit (stomatin/prohibitin family)
LKQGRIKKGIPFLERSERKIMGLFDKLRGELIDIVEWIDDTRNTLVWRFPRYQNEIKQGAQLIVRPGQLAVFVMHGKVADMFEPGTHTLNTQNLPLLSTIAGWKFGFNSPFKSEIYFITTRQITDLKWGTPNPVMLRDPEFGPIRLRAFGTYALKAIEPKALLTELVGTDGVVEADEVTELMRAIISSAMADMLAEKQVAALDLASKYTEFSEELRKYVQERIDDEYGLAIPQLIIVNISLPEAVEKALDTRTSMGVLGDMTKFQQYSLGEAMRESAQHGGGGEGLGLGMGVAMAGRMMTTPGVGMGVPAGGAPVPPPLPAWHIAVNGQPQGPYSPEQVQQSIAAGRITPETLLWSPTIAGWTAASKLPDWAGYFQKAATPTPPPIPPQ